MSAAAREVSRDAILRAAAEIVLEHGYSGTTIARITERCGLPASSIYWFFEDKDDLLAKVVETSFQEFSELIPDMAPLTDRQGLMPDMRRALRPPLQALLAGPVFAQVGLMLTMEERLVGTKPQLAYARIRQQVVTDLETWFSASIGAVHPATDPQLATALSQIVMAFADGLFIVSRAEVSIDIDRYVDTLLAVLAQSVRASAGGLT